VAEEDGAGQGADAENPVQKKDDGASAAKAQAGSNQKLILLVLTLNVVVLIAVAVVFWMSMSKKSTQTSLSDIQEQSQGSTKTSDGPEGGGLDAESRHISESFMVNLSDPKGSYFAKVDVVIEVEDDFVKNEINKIRPKIRDFILVVISSKTYEQVESLDGRNFLREEIRNKINGYLPRGEIKNIYFTQFIIQ